MPNVNKWGANFGRRIGQAGREGNFGGNAGRAIGNAIPKAAKAIPAVGGALNRAGAGLGRGIAQAGREGKLGGNAGTAVGNTVKGLGKAVGEGALQLIPGGIAVSQAIKNLKIVIFAIIAIIILFAYLVFQLSGGLLNPQSPSSQTSSANPLQVYVTCNPSGTKDAPLQVGSTSVCTIIVTDTESPDDITIVATVAPFAQYVLKSATYNGTSGGTYAATTGGDTVTWDAKQLNIPLTSPTFTLTLTVKLTQPYNGAAQGGPISVIATPAGGASATNNDCHSVYSAYMSQIQIVLTRLNITGANYGDPNCALVEQDPNGNWIINKDKELAYLKTILPTQKAEGVFTCMIPNESSYNADAFNPGSTSATNGSGTPGAFGLLQMNAQGFSNTGQPSDVGDVIWSQQLSNAVNWVNNVHGGLWHGDYNGIPNYWPTSYNACLAQYGM